MNMIFAYEMALEVYLPNKLSVFSLPHTFSSDYMGNDAASECFEGAVASVF